jgi:peptidoglycan hydrolase-like protein with peptidoglycan-binding domain
MLRVLDPHDTATGVQARLLNLGVHVGKLDGEVGERTRLALRSFQQAHGIEPSGELDQATCEKLAEVDGQKAPPLKDDSSSGERT